MNAIQEATDPEATVRTIDRLRYTLGWIGNVPAILFNTGFAILSLVTLSGIVFITRPKVVMHDIRPEFWLPLLIVMAPAQIYAPLLSWATIFAGEIPTGPAIAVRQKRIPEILRPLIAFFWLCNFAIGFAIVVSLSKPHRGNPPTWEGMILMLILGSWLGFAAMVYLLLAIRTCTNRIAVLEWVWNVRLVIALAMGVVGVVYYSL